MFFYDLYEEAKKKSSREIEALLSEKDQLLALEEKEEIIKENIALSSRLTDLESLMSKKNRLIALKSLEFAKLAENCP